MIRTMLIIGQVIIITTQQQVDLLGIRPPYISILNTMMVPLKYLSNSRRSLDLSLISFKIVLDS